MTLLYNEFEIFTIMMVISCDQIYKYIYNITNDTDATFRQDINIKHGNTKLDFYLYHNK